MNWHGVPLLPASSILLDAALLSFAACLLMAVAGGSLAMGAQSVRSAQRALRTALFALILATMGLFTMLPSGWKSGWDERLTESGIAEMTPAACLAMLLLTAALAAAGSARMERRVIHARAK
jgi:hypothetical protein